MQRNSPKKNELYQLETSLYLSTQTYRRPPRNCATSGCL